MNPAVKFNFVFFPPHDTELVNSALQTAKVHVSEEEMDGFNGVLKDRWYSETKWICESDCFQTRLGIWELFAIWFSVSVLMWRLLLGGLKFYILLRCQTSWKGLRWKSQIADIWPCTCWVVRGEVPSVAFIWRHHPHTGTGGPAAVPAPLQEDRNTVNRLGSQSVLLSVGETTRCSPEKGKQYTKRKMEKQN